MKKAILKKQNIIIGCKKQSRDEAIARVGNMLVESGYVTQDYIKAMYEREDIVSTFIGNGVAIPHGVGDAKHAIKTSGIVVIQYPEGIEYNGNTVYLVIGIAGKDNDHIKILSRIAESLSEEADAKKLWHTQDIDVIYQAFVGDNT